MPAIPTILRRLALAAAIGGAAVAATPAIASAKSTCSYDPAAKTVTVIDGSGTDKELIIGRTVGGQISIADGSGALGSYCPIPGTFSNATTTNTDQIKVFSGPSNVIAGPGVLDGIVVDQRQGFLGPGATQESDGLSEIEVSINTAGVPARISVYGTQGDDSIRAGAGGRVNLGTFLSYEEDVDITPSVTPTEMGLRGFGGDDLVTGGGNEISRNPGPASFPVVAHGDDGKDQVNGGAAADFLLGGSGDDRFYSVDHSLDVLQDNLGAGSGVDFARVDAKDSVSTSIEQTMLDAPASR